MLLVVDLLLWVLALSLFGLFLAFPAWVVLFVIASIRVAGHTNNFNRRLVAR